MKNLENFRKQYPNVTSADLQSFVLGMQSRNDEVASLTNIVTDIIQTLEGRDTSVQTWIQDRLKEHLEMFE